MSLAEFEALIPAYVGSRMDDVDLPRFEEAVLTHPSWARLVEAEQLLRAGIRDLATTDPHLLDPTGDPA